MKAEVVVVTPEMAALWLERNMNGQRSLRQSVVDRYARDMRSGAFGVTHQGIAFDTKGHLIDGQHRLSAIVKSGCTIKMMVVRDAPSGTFTHIDAGLSRTAKDVLNSQGDLWVTTEHIAIARMLESDGNVRFASIARSPFEIRQMVETHKNAIHFVLQHLNKRRVRNVTTAPVLAAVASAYYVEMDRVRLVEFLTLLVSGVTVDPAVDGTVIRLRDWLHSMSQNTSMPARMDVYLKAQRVIKAYMNREPTLTRLYVPSEPVYPLARSARIE